MKRAMPKGHKPAMPEMPKGHKHMRAGGPAHEMPNGTMMMGDMPMKPMPKEMPKKKVKK